MDDAYTERILVRPRFVLDRIYHDYFFGVRQCPLSAHLGPAVHGEKMSLPEDDRQNLI